VIDEPSWKTIGDAVTTVILLVMIGAFLWWERKGS